jgi:Mn2+/Fe2+ NRAMP family transporter
VSTDKSSAISTHSTGLEPPPSLLAMLGWLGPGLILVGSIVGSGELVATPLVGGSAGYSFLWLILLSCVIKVFFQIEIGRYAISAGKTSLESFDEVAFLIPWGGRRRRFNWLGWYWFIMVMAAIVQQGAMVGGTAQALRLAFPGALGPHTETIFAILSGASATILLLSGQYGVVEKGSILLVALFTVLTLYTVISLQFTPYATSPADLYEGFRFSLPSDPKARQEAVTAALTTFGITGVGASELIAYPYWCLEKGYGKLIGTKDESASRVRRARGWIRVMSVDAWFSMVIFTIATVAFYILAAEILHPAYLAGAELPKGSEMIERLSVMYATTFGSYSRPIYLVGAIAVLYSTLFVATAAHARMLTDWFGLIGVLRRHDEEQRRLSIAILCVVFPQIATLAYLTTQSPVVLVKISGIMQALMLPMLGGAILFLAHRRTDPRIRGNRAWYTLLWIALVLMTMASGFLAYDSVTKLLPS